MKTNKILVGLLSLLALSSCSDKMDYNENVVKGKDYIAQTFEKVGGLMTHIYLDADYDYGQDYSGAMLASATDESVFSKEGTSIETFYNGAWSPTKAQGGMWSKMYEGIKSCNNVLKEFQGLTFDDYKANFDYEQQMYRYENYKWEARFWRAYFYFNLVRQYGGVPIIDMDMAASEVNNQPRKSSDEIFQYIFDECDAIKDNIIKDYTKLGDMSLSSPDDARVNNLGVLALRARAALYWASPLFNPSGDKGRYRTAALYTKELLDACKDRGMMLAPKYADLWSNTNYTTANIKCEIILGRRIYGTGTDGKDATVEKYNYPFGISGGSSASNCPSQNLVDAYEMKATGKGINEAGSGYNPAKPYDGRDPRFEATVAKNGDMWPTAANYKKATLQTYYNGVNGEPQLGATPTGYYLKKLLHGTLDFTGSSKNPNDLHTWVTYRLGEFYLNYAEAVFKYLGSPTATSSEFPMSADEAINKVRARAGMPDFPTTLSNDEFWEKYKNERMVELAFEGHRFWDVRRWKEADKYFKNIQEMKITKNDDGSFTYTRKTVNREWNDKMYFFPIPYDVMLKHEKYGLKWEQNPGW